MTTALIPKAAPGPLTQVPTDWPGQRFAVFEELGDPADITFVGTDENMRLVESESYAHSVFDGVGAAMHFFERRNIDVAQPEQAPGTIPGRWGRLLYLFRFLDLARRGRTLWALPRKATRGAPRDVTIVRLSTDATKRVVGACKAQSLPLTPTLLLAVDQVFAPGWLNAPGRRTWSIPMNMRGAATTDERAYGNFVCAMLLNLNPDDDAKTIQRRMDGYRRRGLQWGSFVINHAVKRRGIDRFRAAQKRRSNRGSIFGVFTNVGRWSAPSLDERAAPLRNLAYTFIPPLAYAVPFAVAAMTVNGRLCLSFAVHPSVDVAPRDVQTRAEAFARKLDELTGQSLGAGVETYTLADIAACATGPRIETKPPGYR